MDINKKVSGFSKFSQDAKVEWVIQNYFDNPEKALSTIMSYRHPDAKIQKLHNDFIENTISNFYMPYGVAPNVKINGKVYCVPMAIEESSVVAAAAKGANFWFDKGGFKAKVIDIEKIGHVHFLWSGNSFDSLKRLFQENKNLLLDSIQEETINMKNRGGGVLEMLLKDLSPDVDQYYQIEVTFNTCDSMGANFINTVLEKIAKVWRNIVQKSNLDANDIEVVMCILSNYTPKCLVRTEVSCPIEQMVEGTNIEPLAFAKRFKTAVEIAETQVYRAVTHNKGIMNGIDSVVIATGNDFRAVEASAHAYASKDGTYRSLTHCDIEDGIFKFWLEVPLSLGTVGGITRLHPMVKFSHELLENPSAQELMMITATVGLAQNFSALRSLTTTGIQQGHMKMHLINVLNELEATEDEIKSLVEFFKDKVPHYRNIVDAFEKLRNKSLSQ